MEIEHANDDAKDAHDLQLTEPAPDIICLKSPEKADLLSPWGPYFQGH